MNKPQLFLIICSASTTFAMAIEGEICNTDITINLMFSNSHMCSHNNLLFDSLSVYIYLGTSIIQIPAKAIPPPAKVAMLYSVSQLKMCPYYNSDLLII